VKQTDDIIDGVDASGNKADGHAGGAGAFSHAGG
jgi:hypothetical protein